MPSRSGRRKSKGGRVGEERVMRVWRRATHGGAKKKTFKPSRAMAVCNRPPAASPPSSRSTHAAPHTVRDPRPDSFDRIVQLEKELTEALKQKRKDTWIAFDRAATAEMSTKKFYRTFRNRLSTQEITSLHKTPDSACEVIWTHCHRVSGGGSESRTD